MTIHRADIARMAASKAEVSQATAMRVLDAISDIIELSIACGEQVTIKGFGSFYPRDLPPRNYVVPVQPGLRAVRELSTPERMTMAFVPGRSLRDRLNKAPETAVPPGGTPE